MLPILRKRLYLPNYGDNYFSRTGSSSFFSDGADYTTPAINIKENENSYKIEVAAPGLNKEDFKIRLEKNILAVSSEKEIKEKEEMDNFMRREFSYHSFCRSFLIPDTVNVDKIKATHQNGILTIELPKQDEAKHRQNRDIKVN
jgi:HSP20 family protein